MSGEPQAGTETDELVAELIMGWKFEFMTDSDGYDHNCWIRGSEILWDEAPRYSTDIAAAWMVMEHMRQGHKSVVPRIDSLEHKRWEQFQQVLWEASYPWGGDETDAWDNALFMLSPLSICVAALKAYGRTLQ